MAERKKFYRPAPQTAREVLAGIRLVARAGRQAVLDRWDGILPAALRGHVHPLRWERSVLWLKVDGAIWAQEVRMLAPQLLRGINALAGTDAVTELKTKVVPPR